MIFSNGIKFWRVNLILFLVILCFGIISIRLFNLQVTKGDFYKALAQGQQNIFEEISGKRGEIFLQNKNGEMIPLGINHSWFFVFVHPNRIQDKEKTSESLSEILSIKKELILEDLNNGSNYIVLKEKLTNEEKEKIEELNYEGVYISKKEGRYYPQNQIASKVLGFVNTEGLGKYGIEEIYNEKLIGKEGMFTGKRTMQGFLLDPEQENTEEGSDLFLTIDYNVQLMAEKLLEEAEKNLEIESGQIIIMDPQTGKIIALADFPNFDPNEYKNYAQNGSIEIFQNSVTQKFFEPGSIFKPLTMAISINEDKITPDTTYFDSGRVDIGRWPIYNYDNRSYGEQTMTEVLEKSINTGAVFASQQVSPNIFLEYMEKFGLFDPTGIDLFENYSANSQFKKGYDVNFATASFGQGIEMTPIQILRAFSAVLNDGKIITPFIVENGSVEKLSKEILSKKTANQIEEMMVSVVEKGYSKSAGIKGYRIGGKTGTAQVSYGALGINKPGYSDKTVQSFIGFGPKFSNKFLILVKLDNPLTKTAEYSAGPIFRKMMQYLIDYYQIPPDYSENI